MTKRSLTASVAVVVLALSGLSPAWAGGGGDRIRLSCRGEGDADISISARFQERRGRIKFDASFEAAPGAGFEAGELLDVVVGGVFLGQMELVRNADVEGDLNFDTRAQRDDDDLPLPADFPAVGAGTSVVVGPLGCALQ